MGEDALILMQVAALHHHTHTSPTPALSPLPQNIRSPAPLTPQVDVGDLEN